MKAYIALGVALVLLLFSIASCERERGRKDRAMDDLAAANKAHATEMATARATAWDDAAALVARNVTQRASEGDAWEKGFALGSARCGL